MRCILWSIRPRSDTTPAHCEVHVVTLRCSAGPSPELSVSLATLRNCTQVILQHSDLVAKSYFNSLCSGTAALHTTLHMIQCMTHGLCFSYSITLTRLHGKAAA